uniref:Uncharacterized protein n=1 Tax=Chlamydomonas euryale TaxID=1486919 RepID=A0A7R9Z6E2_9CHLO
MPGYDTRGSHSVSGAQPLADAESDLNAVGAELGLGGFGGGGGGAGSGFGGVAAHHASWGDRLSSAFDAPVRAGHDGGAWISPAHSWAAATASADVAAATAAAASSMRGVDLGGGGGGGDTGGGGGAGGGGSSGVHTAFRDPYPPLGDESLR